MKTIMQNQDTSGQFYLINERVWLGHCFVLVNLLEAELDVTLLELKLMKYRFY